MKTGVQVGAILAPRDVAALYGVTTTELARWRRMGDGPSFYVLGRNPIRYDSDDVTDWFNDPDNAYLHDYPAGH
ncbi:AlpA family transcriptional regulator [uncultured Arthrobacter sp.]|uniref:helix-turn-helix transcriptional regulator n=1 Tax=uncultured Arthrobacter sp. TaxID=114050 RepID=UPI0026214D4E|nr:hypothetical protein [uncultured Arthrobacter sp.]